MSPKRIAKLLREHSIDFFAGNPAQYLIAQRYLESLTEIAAGAQKVVYLPYEASAALGSLGGIRELLQTAPAKG